MTQAQHIELLSAQLQQLTKIIDPVPYDILDTPQAIDGRSVKAILCMFSSWDGESLRRIDFVTGQRFEPPHNPADDAFWQTWLEQQIAVKKIMPVRGVLVDLVGTRQRLISRIAELNDFQLEYWLESDPQAGNPAYSQYLPKIETWCQQWLANQQIESSSLWHKLRKLFKH